MKLAILASAPITVWRGVEQFIDQIATDLLDEGIEVEILARVSSAQQESSWIRARKPKYNYRFLALPRIVYDFLPILITSGILLGDVDVFYVQFFDPVFLSILVLTGKPIIVVLHGVTDLNGRALRVMVRLMKPFKRFLHIQALNHSQERYFLKLGYQVTTIPSAVPSERLLRELKSSDEFNVWFSSMDAGKGADKLINLARLSKQKGLGVYFVVTGSGSLESELQAASKSLGNIKVKGRLSQIQLNQVYAESSLFLSLSNGESFSLAAAEAQVNGLPVIATPTDGLRDMIIDDFLGNLIPYDAERYLNAIRRYFDLWSSDKDGYVKMKSRIANRQRKRYSWSVMLTTLKRFLLEVAASSKVC